MKWRTIESVPLAQPPHQFGPLVMLWTGTRIVHRRAFAPGVFWNKYDNGFEGDWFKPTHWMPLPAPPPSRVIPADEWRNVPSAG